jgi:ribosomal protein L2
MRVESCEHDPNRKQGVTTMSTTTSTTRRTATAADLTIGALVYKGNGSTLWRVWAVWDEATYGRTTRASVVKATTATDPKRGCFYRADEFTVEVAA